MPQYDIWRQPYSKEQISAAVNNIVPTIDPVTRNWRRWDIENMTWVDTGISADADVTTITSNRGPLPSDVGTPGQRWLDTAHGNVEYTCVGVTVGTPNTYTWLYTGGCNPNLLDNWYFVGGGSQQGGGQFPINQRGQTSYSYVNNITGYLIDRWKSNLAVTANLIANGLSVSNNGVQYGGIWQQSERFKQAGPAQYTFSVLFSGDDSGWATSGWYIDIQCAKVTSGDSIAAATTVESAPGTNKLLSVTLTVPKTTDSDLYFRFFVCNKTTYTQHCTIIAAKLELGSTQTLAHQDENGNWVLNEVPNFQQELAKCQRYQVALPFVIGRAISTAISDGYGEVVFPISLPVTPRSNGTLSILSGQLRLHGPNIDYFNVTPNQASTVQGNIADISISGLERMTPYTIDGYPPGTILFDFNL